MENKANSRTSLYIPPDIKKQFSALLVARGISMNQFFNDTIRKELSSSTAVDEIRQLLPSRN